MTQRRKTATPAIRYMALAALGTGLLTGIAASLGSSPASAEKPLNVVVTIKPVHSLVSMVMEGIGKPALLVDGQSSPHSYALKPSDARALDGADVVVRIADTVEPFTRRIAETLPSKTTMVTLADVKGMELLEIRRDTAFEPHDHGDEAGHEAGHDAHQGEDHAHEQHAKSDTHDHDGHAGHKAEHKEEHDAAHKHEDEHNHKHENKHAHEDHHDHEAGAIDGHVWLDPSNAKTIVRAVADVLAKQRPDLKEALAANVTAALARIDALDAELKEQLTSVKSKPFIVFHDAYQYFERHFGLHAAGSITLSPEVAPSAKRLSEIRATLKKSGAHCVFAEPQFSPRIINSVIEGSKAKAGTLDPLGSTFKAGSDQYGELMRSLGTSMRDCLGHLG